MQRPSAIIATALALLLAAAGSTAATASSLEEGRLAVESFHSALGAAQLIRDDAAEVRGQLVDATVAGNRSTAEATAIVALPAGVLDTAAVGALAPLMEALAAVLPRSVPGSLVLPTVASPTVTAELRDAADLFLDWSGAASDAEEVSEDQLDAVQGAVDDLDLAIAAAARSVSPQSTAALAAAPLASVDTRAAIQPAVTAVREQIRTGSDTAGALQAYSAAVSALSASQAAGAAAAAQAAAEAAERNNYSAPVRRVPMTAPPLWEINCYWDDYGTQYCTMG